MVMQMDHNCMLSTRYIQLLLFEIRIMSTDMQTAAKHHYAVEVIHTPLFCQLLVTLNSRATCFDLPASIHWPAVTGHLSGDGYLYTTLFVTLLLPWPWEQQHKP